jgi:hypothetical protein
MSPPPRGTAASHTAGPPPDQPDRAGLTGGSDRISLTDRPDRAGLTGLT